MSHIKDRLSDYHDFMKKLVDYHQMILASDALEMIEQLKDDLEQDEKENGWIPVDWRLPETDDYILVSFSNYTLPDIGRYEADKDGGGAFFPGDEERSYVSFGLFVNAWMPLPEPYKED